MHCECFKSATWAHVVKVVALSREHVLGCRETSPSACEGAEQPCHPLDVPSTYCWASRTSSLGGLGRRSGWSLVGRDQDLPSPSGPRKGQIRTAHPPRQGKASVEIAMCLHPCVQRSSSICRVSLNLRLGGGADGVVPRTHAVVNDFRHEGLSSFVPD